MCEDEEPDFNSRCLRILTHPRPVPSIAVREGLLFAGGSVWHLSDPTKKATKLDTKSKVTSLVVAGDKLFTGHEDNKLRVWHVPRLRLAATLPGSAWKKFKIKTNKGARQCGEISTIAISKNVLYSVSTDGAVKMWCTSSLKLLGSFIPHGDKLVKALAVDQEREIIYTSSSSEPSITAWKRTEEQHKLCTVKTLQCPVSVNALATYGGLLFGGGKDSSVYIWDNCHELEAILPGHQEEVVCVTAVDELLCTGSTDGTMRLWKRTTGGGVHYTCVLVVNAHQGGVHTVILKTDQCSRGVCDIYSGGADCLVKMWRVYSKSHGNGETEHYYFSCEDALTAKEEAEWKINTIRRVLQLEEAGGHFKIALDLLC